MLKLSLKLQKKYWESNEPSYETTFTNQPRPNVLFEAGMAFGVHLKRTILVQVGNIKPISDPTNLKRVRVHYNH